MKQARSFKWVCCTKCGASIIAGKPCDVCADIKAAREREALADDAECEGHPAGPFDPMGQTVYCDGSCRKHMRR